MSGGTATLIAAIIAAAASFIGLVLAKEQKISEFRQSWIDDLRGEISDYLSIFTQIRDEVQRNFSTQSEKIAHLSPMYSRLNRASNLIRLRLNPEEDLSQDVVGLMDEMENLSGDDTSLAGDAGDALENELREKSQQLLKCEWDRVRKGEDAYRNAKIAASVIALMMLGFLLYLLLAGVGDPEKKEGRASQIIVEGDPHAGITKECVSHTAEPFTPCQRKNLTE